MYTFQHNWIKTTTQLTTSLLALSLSFTSAFPTPPPSPPLLPLTGGLPRVGRLLSWSPTSAGPCGVANSRISPVLVGAAAGWSPSLLGLVMMTIWWSSPRLILPEFSKVSKSANRSSDVCPVIRVSDMAVSQTAPLDWTLEVVGGLACKPRCWSFTEYQHLLGFAVLSEFKEEG